jgi:hypothetical protein
MSGLSAGLGCWLNIVISMSFDATLRDLENILAELNQTRTHRFHPIVKNSLQEN